MNDFNYEKAYFLFAEPSFKGLNTKQLDAHSKLRVLGGELQQDESLNIPLSPAMQSILDELSTQELAEMSRASYFLGHWKPSHTIELFDNKRGESWKVANLCDQVLRQRLNAPHNIQIHEGILRVTFSSRDCWLWDEFGLATESNLQTYKDCGLPFGEDTLNDSAKQLKTKINDLWLTDIVDSLPNNDSYLSFLEIKKAWQLKELKKRNAEKIESLKKDVENAKIELDAFTWLIQNDVDTENCIFYDRKDVFCFGWRNKLTPDEGKALIPKLIDFPYQYELK